jgi:hypothetical protein
VVEYGQENTVKRKRKKRTPREHPAVEWRESRTVKRQDELHTADGILAALRWASMFSYLATGQAGDKQWQFDRPRIFSREVEVRVAGSDAEAPFAVYYPGWTPGGQLEFGDGRTLRWFPTNFWQTQWVFTDDAEQVLMQFEDTSRILDQRAAVTFVRQGLAEADRALLLVLGRYLLAVQARDNAAIAASVSTAAVT